ncbi:MAG TPA: hypothetical protein VFG50_08235 [Rhodothermales bacterium]|nr:hypothetical protein [Rhodothermales bacterium]
MNYNANIYRAYPAPEQDYTPAVLNELSSVGSRQIAERDRVVSRLYTAVLAGTAPYPAGRPVWVDVRQDGSTERETFVGYPVLQKGRVLRLHRRDGEFVPGLVLEQLGAYERGGGFMVTGSDDWFVTADGPNVYVTADFRTYEDVSTLRGALNGPLLWVGRRLVAGSVDQIFVSDDGAAWQALPVDGAAEVWALAWDGLVVWVAAEGGTYTVDLDGGAVVQVDPAPAHGLTYQFMNFDLYRAAYNGTGYDVTTRNGDPFRTIGYDLFQLAHNWVLLDGWHYVTDLLGDVRRFDGTSDAVIGSLFVAGRSSSWAQATFLVRDAVLAVGYGRLALVAGDTLRIVYDFGDDVRAFPCLGGFIVVRRDGLLYRVRRIATTE